MLEGWWGADVGWQAEVLWFGREQGNGDRGVRAAMSEARPENGPRDRSRGRELEAG